MSSAHRGSDTARAENKSSHNILTVTLFTALSRVLGFVRLAVIGTLYGAGGEADVVHLVFQIPNNLRRLLAEGALSSAFIPTLSGTLIEGRRATLESWTLTRTLFGLQWALLIPLLTVSALFSSEITLTLFDLPSSELQSLADRLFKFLVWYAFPISIAAITMAVLQIHGYFTVPALTPILFSITVISSMALFYQRYGVFAVAIGVVVGGVAQVAIQLPRFRALGYRLRPSFNFRHPAFRRVIRFWGPVTVGSALFAINQQIASYFASGLSSGSASAMINALTFWQLPFGLLGVSVITVLYPKMSAAYSAGNQGDMRDTLEYGISYLMVTAIPATVYLLVMPYSMIAVALQRGAFTVANTELASRVLSAYSWGLPSVILYYFVQRFYYSCHNYRTPIVSAGVVLGIDVALSLWLKNTHLRVAGLAYANTIAFSCGVVYLFLRIPPHHAPRLSIILKRVVRVLGAVVIPTVLLILYKNIFGHRWREGGALSHALPFALFTLVYICATLLCYRWFRVQPVIHRLVRR